MMRFVDFTPGCEPLAINISQIQKPEPGPEQVLVKVSAFGLNRADTLQRQGKYPPPPGESSIMGLEVAGEVISTGSRCSIYKPGDKVFGLVAGGGYAEYVAVNEQHLMPVPENVPPTEAAAIAEVFLTAFQSLLWLGNLQSIDKVLIHAGASGVGLAAIQLAKAVGATVAVTASSFDKLEYCRSSGADLLINYKQQDFVQTIKEHFQGVDLVLDMVAGEYLNRNLKILNQDGTIVNLAMMGGRQAEVDMALLLGKRATIKGSTLRNRSDDYKAKLISAFNERFLPLFSQGKLKANVQLVLNAEDAGQGHQLLEQNLTTGKLICVWN